MFLLGNVYIGDELNHRVRKVTVSSGIISTIAGAYAAGISGLGDNGLATSALLNQPNAVTLDSQGDIFPNLFQFYILI